jgi:hypothetical protein
MPEEVLFTVLGAVLGVGGGLIKSRDDARHAAKAFAREHAARIEAERVALQRAAYLRLMTHARELRFVSRRIFRGKPAATEEQVDDLKGRLSNAYYEIAILASPPTVEMAWKLRRAVFDYWNGARDTPTDASAGEDLRTAAGLAHDAFENHVRDEFEYSASPSESHHPVRGRAMSDA